MEVPEDLIAKFDKMDAEMLSDFKEEAEENVQSKSETTESIPPATPAGEQA